MCCPMTAYAFPTLRQRSGSDSEAEAQPRNIERIGRTGLYSFGTVDIEPIFIDSGVSDSDWAPASRERAEPLD